MFIIWGALHGSAIVFHRAWQQLGFKMYSLLAWFITFNFINITWIFFRAREWEDALKILKAMFSGSIVLPSGGFFDKYFHFQLLIFSNSWLSNIYADKYILWYLLGTLLLVMFTKNSSDIIQKFRTNLFYSISFVTLFVISFLNLSGVHEFLYFNF